MTLARLIPSEEENVLIPHPICLCTALPLDVASLNSLRV
jgi:hypothetical protein